MRTATLRKLGTYLKGDTAALLKAVVAQQWPEATKLTRCLKNELEAMTEAVEGQRRGEQGSASGANVMQA